MVLRALLCFLCASAFACGGEERDALLPYVGSWSLASGTERYTCDASVSTVTAASGAYNLTITEPSRDQLQLVLATVASDQVCTFGATLSGNMVVAAPGSCTSSPRMTMISGGTVASGTGTSVVLSLTATATGDKQQPCTAQFDYTFVQKF